MGRASSFWHSRSRRRAASAPATPRPEPPVGCMSMVHYLIFTPGAGCVGRPPAGVSSSVSASASGVVTPHGLHRGTGGSSSNKSGFEAPRNSLDLDADGDFCIGVQVEPVFDALAARAVTTGGGGCAARRGGGGKGKGKPATAANTAPSSEAATPRTPSLVARLMGIDGLPDDDDDLLLSPAPGLQKHQQQHKKQTASGSSKKNAAFDNSNNKENAWTTTAAVAGTTTPTSSGKEKKKRVIPESMTTRRDRDREPLRSLSCNVPAAAGGQPRQSRSLPDTPRASTSASARASWDGPRLSLQALRDNVLERAAQYMSMPSSPTSSSSAAAGKKKKDGGRRRRDETAAAKEHAREILRQAKETVASRKTSSSNSNSKQHSNSSSNKENVPSHPTPARVPDMEEEEDKLVVVVHGSSSCTRPPTQAPPPCAAANKPQGNPHPSSQRQSPSPVRVPLAPRQAPPPHPPQRAKPSRPPPPPPPLDPPPTRARRPDGCERFATRIKKPGAGVVPSSASTPSSSASPSPCAPPTAAAVPLEEDPEYSYLRKVLERGGFMRPPPCRRPARASSSLHCLKPQQPHWPPVDPIVFHLLELELPADEAEERALGPLRHRWNRKLLFHAAQEVLAGLLLLDASSATGPALLGKVWATVRGFPGADCRVVGDIDALVAADLEREPWSCARRRHPAVVADDDAARGVVADAVAERVLDALLAELCAAEAESWGPLVVVVGGTCGGAEVAVTA